MSKYILDPNGKIKKVNNQEGVTSSEFVDAKDVTSDILKNQSDFFEARRPKEGNLIFNPARVSLKAGLLSNTFVDNDLSTLIKSEKNEFVDGDNFPQKKDSNILVNSSFGADPQSDVSYYIPFNSIFSNNKNNSRIYAEELHMLAGFDLNSIGFFSGGTREEVEFEFTQIVFLFDFIVESISYISTFWLINILDDELGPTNKNYSPIAYYFKKILNIGNFVNTNDLFDLLNYFIAGFDRFVNTDPKLKGFRDLDGKEKQMQFTSPYRSNFIEAVTENKFYKNAQQALYSSLIYIARNFLSLSKVGKNRVFLLIRKFQQESYWQSEILYKGKKETSENFADDFFVQFSNYYFKFIIERINIGYIVCHTDSFHSKINDFHTSINTLTFDNKKNYLFYEKTTSINTNDYTDADKFEFHYKWSSKKALESSSFNTSLRSLPQLLMTQYHSTPRHIFNLGRAKNRQDDNMFAIRKQNSQAKRLPYRIVEEIEDYTGQSYMPFYLHDLRTNEIVSMHAFIDSITDSFSPEYSSNSGFGRIDDVKHYVKTTRNINITFNLIAMQKDDLFTLWSMVNKIVTMVYPQWSKGIPANSGKFKDIADFEFPFTQVPTASPLVRLRVGDVITSNYSEDNLKRLHGDSIIHPKFKLAKNKDIKDVSSIVQNYAVKLYQKGKFSKNMFFRGKGSTKDLVSLGKIYYDSIKEFFFHVVKDDKSNVKSVVKIDYDVQYDVTINDKKTEYNFYALKIYEKNLGLINNKESAINWKNWFRDKDGRYIQVNLRQDQVNKLPNKFNDVKDQYNFRQDVGGDRTLDTFSQEMSGPNKIDNLLDKRDDFISLADGSRYFALDERDKNFDYENASPDERDNYLSYITGVSRNTGKVINPYTAAFDSTKGKGLAGFITSLDVNYQDSTFNIRDTTVGEEGYYEPLMPHSVKITLGFSPVHDIAPGIDHRGVNRAPVYTDHNSFGRNYQDFRKDKYDN